MECRKYQTSHESYESIPQTKQNIPLNASKNAHTRSGCKIPRREKKQSKDKHESAASPAFHPARSTAPAAAAADDPAVAKNDLWLSKDKDGRMQNHQPIVATCLHIVVVPSAHHGAALHRECGPFPRPTSTVRWCVCPRFVQENKQTHHTPTLTLPPQPFIMEQHPAAGNHAKTNLHKRQPQRCDITRTRPMLRTDRWLTSLLRLRVPFKTSQTMLC